MTERSSLADDLRQRLRASSTHDSDWVVPINDALAEAYRRASTEDIAEVALLGAVWLDASGRLDEAVANIDFALSTIGASSGHRSHLLCARAGLLAIAGRVGTARATLVRARTALEEDARSQLEVETYEQLLACVALDDARSESIASVIGAAERAGLDWLASGLTIWFVPWLAARGSTSEASTWAGALTARASASRHAVRAADARSLQVSIDAAHRGEADWDDLGRTAAHAPARWRVALALTRTSMLAGRWEEARRALAEHESRIARMNPGFRLFASGFAACVDAYMGHTPVAPPQPSPVPVTLVSLPAILASAEAAALGSSVEACLGWFEALARVPSNVTTCLEWPVAVDRVRALLLVRLGRVGRARSMFQRAIQAMEAAGNPIEVELACLHRAESEALGAVRPDRRLVRQRGEAARRLAALGVSPFPPAYALSRALSDDRVGAASDLLTAREVEVVRALADGLSYRGAAERLGISWRTVQSHATRAYHKLGVSRRSEAVAAARARRLIDQ